MNNKHFKFVDLFAGIGGFHQALEELGGFCVTASEINESCVATYKNNFQNTPIVGDINLTWNSLPKFDVLCGGFPCQPFSKAGKQDGFDDKERGNLFDVIIEILKIHDECKFIILENVRNLSDKTENWDKIQKELRQLNFYVTEKPLILSPSQFGIPQIRERVYILGIRKDIRDIIKLKNGYIHLEELGLTNLPPAMKSLQNGDAWKILDSKHVDEKYNLDDSEVEVLDIWDEFRKGTRYESSNVPVWLDYMGIFLSDTEYESMQIYQVKEKTNRKITELPEWKQKFARKNRKFYIKHKKFIDRWTKEHNMLDRISTHKKFEWNCGDDFKSLREVIVQFRHSGIRAKRPNYFPTLVAINNTPVIWDYNKKTYRYITPREAANLQSFNENYKFSENDMDTYKQLGNSVNVSIVRLLAEKLFSFAIEEWVDEVNENDTKN